MHDVRRVIFFLVILSSGLPGAPVLAADRALDWWARAAVYQTKYYTVKSDLEAADAEALGAHMDATFESYLLLFSKLPLHLRRPARLALYLFADQEDYLAVLATRFGADGTGSGAQCITRGQQIAIASFRGEKSTESMKSSLQHEGFHQVARHFFPRLPPWADEGLAVLFGRGVLVGGTLALGEYTQSDKARLTAAVQGNRLLPFDEFFAITGNRWGQQVREGVAGENYLEAWSLVHYCLFAENRKYEPGFLAFLVQLNRGIDWRAAFVNAFGTPDFRTMERKWLDYVQHTPTTDYRETLGRLDFLAAGMAKLYAQNVHPASFDELKMKLQELGFAHTSQLFGQSRPMSAAESAVFDVPGEGGRRKPRFVLVDGRGHLADERQPRGAARPLNIMTTGLDIEQFRATGHVRGRALEYQFSAEPASRKKGP